MTNGYDIIGDVHGMADVLVRLLEKMGYSKNHDTGVFSHPEGRIAIFVGDLIDRGIKGFETVNIAKSMTEAGHAITVMGNHELNAIFFHTQGRSGMTLRQHSAKNIEQHHAFLYQLAMTNNDSNDGPEIIAWFKTLPLYYENEHFRVVHACWDSESKARLDNILDENNRLPHSQYENAAQKGHEVFDLVEKWLKGDEQKLPEGVSFFDKSKVERKEARLRWWMADGTALEDLAMLQGDKASIAEIRASLKGHQVTKRVLYTDMKPVFVGHYWMKDEPKLQSEYVCCVDYSAGKGDKLCAYRWDGETKLSHEKFIYENLT